MQPYVDTAADLRWIKTFLTFIAALAFRRGRNDVGRLKRR